VVGLKGVDQPEARLKAVFQRRHIVSGDGQPTALLWSVDGKYGNNEVTTGAKRRRGPFNVCRLVRGLCQEVKRCPIVPHIDRFVDDEVAHITVDESDGASALRQTGPELAERGSGDVHGINRSIAAPNQVDNQC
jgi:hypothetical protein